MIIHELKHVLESKIQRSIHQTRGGDMTVSNPCVEFSYFEILDIKQTYICYIIFQDTSADVDYDWTKDQMSDTSIE